MTFAVVVVESTTLRADQNPAHLNRNENSGEKNPVPAGTRDLCPVDVRHYPLDHRTGLDISGGRAVQKHAPWQPPCYLLLRVTRLQGWSCGKQTHVICSIPSQAGRVACALCHVCYLLSALARNSAVSVSTWNIVPCQYMRMGTPMCPRGGGVGGDPGCPKATATDRRRRHDHLTPTWDVNYDVGEARGKRHPMPIQQPLASWM